jgi:hypothetical protein
MLKRAIGECVRINPYSGVTGEILGRKDSTEESCAVFDYKVKVNIPVVDKDTIYFANYNQAEGYWWNYFNDDELDKLERNYEMVMK